MGSEHVTVIFYWNLTMITLRFECELSLKVHSSPFLIIWLQGAFENCLRYFNFELKHLESCSCSSPTPHTLRSFVHTALHIIYSLSTDLLPTFFSKRLKTVFQFWLLFKLQEHYYISSALPMSRNIQNFFLYCIQLSQGCSGRFCEKQFLHSRENSYTKM